MRKVSKGEKHWDNSLALLLLPLMQMYTDNKTGMSQWFIQSRDLYVTLPKSFCINLHTVWYDHFRTMTRKTLLWDLYVKRLPLSSTKDAMSIDLFNFMSIEGANFHKRNISRIKMQILLSFWRSRSFRLLLLCEEHEVHGSFNGPFKLIHLTVNQVGRFSVNRLRYKYCCVEWCS